MVKSGGNRSLNLRFDTGAAIYALNVQLGFGFYA